MKNNFTAIDFETAQGYRHSICQVGLVRVENGNIVNEVNLLVQPPDNYYWSKLTEIHGITAEDTIHSPTFDKVWNKIELFITGQTVVAHNGMSFDFPVLDKTLAFYGVKAPVYHKVCTYKIFRKKLNLLCQDYAIALNHHDALSDARACAALYQIYLNSNLN